MSDLGLAGKAAIVTGAAGGLGFAFAEGLARAGARVAIADLNGDAARKAASTLCVEGGQAIAVTADVADEVSVGAMVDRVVGAYGAVDILINNASIYAGLQRKPFYEVTATEWDRVMSVNLKGPFLCARAVYPHMKGRGGKIVNVASATVFSGSPLWMHYVASKGGVIAMTRVLARELGDDGITANALAPGFTLTEASRAAIPDAETYGVSRGAIRRAAVPGDMVGACLWLASPLSDFVTGQTVIVDGGRQFI
ncbi:MAG: glucose 1-dehydrogenase [Rhodospirillales bacterium]|nr:glucose 1-dehydrogenase [Rhodospirillales bacterium]